MVLLNILISWISWAYAKAYFAEDRPVMGYIHIFISALNAALAASIIF